MRDRLGRPLKTLRLSLTDRCNLRCRYCMPERDYAWLHAEALLTDDEVVRLAALFTDLGVERIRLTGGEPLLRPHLANLVERLAGLPGLRDLALTTNGVLLARQAAALRRAGLHRLTVSLDTLREATFLQINRTENLFAVLEGIDAARKAGFMGTKVDTVVIRGVNDDELPGLLAFGRAHELELRFIEYMDVGGATSWTAGQVVGRQEMLERLAHAQGGPIESLRRAPGAPAERFRLEDGTIFGIISSMTQPFCGSCDRARVTADGHLFTCLYARAGLNLRPALRAEGIGPCSADELRKQLANAWSGRADRAAAERLGLSPRGPLVSPADLVAEPLLEMHTRGG